jgi:diaminohydroxyphosphoribosylaminopyrimidine deaminase/5-amino-6-(5-phosphoribosylamino)uracil reductase
VIDQEYMAMAVRLAKRGIYTTHPNPNVGCVIVKDGRVIGSGWHRQAGGPHAEVYALREAGDDARSADVYLSLEPCSYKGRTPPCADALVKAGVKRVVVAMQDPNPRVAGGGLERLRAAGIEVETGLLEAEAGHLNPGYIARMQRGYPWVRVKLASSVDGRTAMASGESHWISSAEARQDVQRLRARSSAIVTGIGTVLADDPSMNVRLEAQQLYGVEPVRQPLRVILDSQLRTPGTAKIENERWHTLQEAGAKVVAVANEHGQPKPEAVLQLLAEREVNEVLLECGPTLAGAFLSQGLVDEIVLYMAPHLMGDGARGLFHMPGLDYMQDRIALKWQEVRQVGSDLRITARPN